MPSDPWSLWPACPRCHGPVLPLSDYGEAGAAVFVKAWACLNEECRYALRIDKGAVSYGGKRGDEDFPPRRRSGER